MNLKHKLLFAFDLAVGILASKFKLLKVNHRSYTDRQDITGWWSWSFYLKQSGH